MTTLRYFAYGSNLSCHRLAARVPSARKITTGRLADHRLDFHKVGRDGSGKCTITACPGNAVFGVIYDMHAAERPLLDACEDLGRGYRSEEFEIAKLDGGVAVAFSYVALLVDPSLLPYRWYHHHVLSGAEENGLPAPYLEELRAIPSTQDPDPSRHAREMAIYEKAFCPGEIQNA